MSENTIANLQNEIKRLEAERDAIGLKLTQEWQGVFAAIAGDTMECLETVKEVELNVPGHPFYHGKMSVLVHMRALATPDEKRFANGAPLLAELTQLRALAAAVQAHRDSREGIETYQAMFAALEEWEKVQR